METEKKVRSNNQNANIQDISSTSHASHSEGTNDIYICIPRGSSIHSFRAVPHYHKFKPPGKVNNHIRLKTPSELRESNVFYENSTEEPIDLTCTEKRCVEQCSAAAIQNVPSMCNSSKLEIDNSIGLKTNSIHVAENNYTVNDGNTAKTRGRKKKYIIKNEKVIQEIPTLELDPLKTLDSCDFFQVTHHRQAEVLKAAKSLFSKRTRTLFHWMYPNAPKAQLKTAVASSWETLGEQEKDFYISQVLGRFGFPQTNLMVNPQLGGLSGILSLPTLNLTAANQDGNEETSSAVSSLLLSENGNDGSWMHISSSSISPISSPYTQRINRKRGRPPGSKNRKVNKEEFPLLTQFRDEPTVDEFQDDPELSREFQQFRWNLHLNENNKP